jgi:hypothetical protein
LEDRAIEKQGTENERDESSAKVEQGLLCLALKRHREGARKQQNPDQNKSTLSRDIREPVCDVARQHRGWIWAAPQAHRQPDHISANNRWQKKCAEEASGVALGAGAEIKLGSRRVHHHPPFSDADGVGAEITNQNCQEGRQGNSPDRFSEQMQGKEPQQNADHRYRRQPAQRNQPSAAVAILRVVGANHSAGAA